MVDTGASVSIWPQNRPVPKAEPGPRILAANGQTIPTFGYRNIGISLNGTYLSHKFVLAAISKPILGLDFLEQQDLTVCVRQRELLHQKSGRIFSAAENEVSAAPGVNNISTCPPAQRLLNKYPSITRVSESGYSTLRAAHGVQHYIETDQARPIRCKARPLYGEKYTAAQAEFKQLEEAGIIRRASSPWASPLHVVKKEDGSLRPCGDYRLLNNQTKPDTYAVPNLREMNFALEGKRVFSRIDLVKGYFQVPVHPADIEKTAIITPFGTFEFLYMPFGLRNAAATFQRLMDKILEGLPFIFVYLDDILVSSVCEKSHERDLETVFKRLEEAGLVINIKKSEFFKEQVDFLGHQISAEGMRPLDRHVEAVKEFPRPQSKPDIMRFAGLINFFRTFIPGAAGLLQPLTDCLKKNSGTFKWTKSMQESFDSTKEALASATILQHPIREAEVKLATDASDTHIGGVLTQRRGPGHQWAPLAFYSKKLTPAEKNYSVFDRELLAAVRGVKKWRHFIEGRKFVLHSDHKSLIPALARTRTADSPRQQRQLTYLSEVAADFQYLPGELNVDADAMSRPAAAAQPEPVVYALLPGDLPTDWKDQDLAAAQQKDQEILQLVERLKGDPKFSLQKTRGGVYVVSRAPARPNVTARPQVLLPKEYRESGIEAVHNSTHPGIRGTRKLVAARYMWPKMNTDVANKVRCCDSCQRSKVTRHERTSAGHFPKAQHRFGTVHLDIVGPLPESAGNKYLVTMIDRATRYPVAVPIKAQDLDSVWSTFQDNWIGMFGVPRTLYTDRGSVFTSDQWASRCQLFGIEHRVTPAYHPQTNGMVERWHRTLKEVLKTTNSREDWAPKLPLLLLGLRARPIADAGLSPHQLLFGTELVLPGDFISVDSEELDGVQFYQKLKEVREGYVYPEHHHNKQDQYQISKELQDAKYVLVRIDRHLPPLKTPYEGPYKVLEKSTYTFTIFNGRTEDKVSVDRLKPFHYNPLGEGPRAPTPPRRGRPPGRTVQPLPTRAEQEDFPALVEVANSPARTRRSKRLEKVPKKSWNPF